MGTTDADALMSDWLRGTKKERYPYRSFGH